MIATLIVTLVVTVTLIVIMMVIIGSVEHLGRQPTELRGRRCKGPRYRDVESPVDIDIYIYILGLVPAFLLSCYCYYRRRGVPGRRKGVESGLPEGRDKGIRAREEGRELRIRRASRNLGAGVGGSGGIPDA